VVGPSRVGPPPPPRPPPPHIVPLGVRHARRAALLREREERRTEGQASDRGGRSPSGRTNLNARMLEGARADSETSVPSRAMGCVQGHGVGPIALIRTLNATLCRRRRPGGGGPAAPPDTRYPMIPAGDFATRRPACRRLQAHDSLSNFAEQGPLPRPRRERPRRDRAAFRLPLSREGEKKGWGGGRADLPADCFLPRDRAAFQLPGPWTRRPRVGLSRSTFRVSLSPR
jgi:hypothetical protein